MRAGLIALALVGLLAPAWGQAEPEVYFLSPQAGAAIEGAPWVTVTGRARGPRIEAPAGFDVMLIIDTSGSTVNSSRAVAGNLGWGVLGGGPGFPVPPVARQDSILGAEVTAALKFLDQSGRPGTRVGVVTFAGPSRPLSGAALAATTTAWVVQPLTFDLQAVRSALLGVLARGSDGGTDMAAGLRLAVRELLALEGAASAPRLDGRKVALLLTDGLPTMPFGTYPANLDVTLNVARVAAKGGILVHTFCLGPEALGKPATCTEIARITGGRHHLVETPADIVEILPRTSIGRVELLSVRNVTTGQMARSLTVGPDGQFTAEVPLAPGENRVVVDLLAGAGAHKSAVLIVQYGERDVQIQVERERKRSLEIEIERADPGR
ncbi:MAG TPA: vWA domain-containing protein [Methylomirabilota bacterium]|nr:vWA domain-containing protein [Methylomirabilota bacterium]